jgi:hypothetical protein
MTPEEAGLCGCWQFIAVWRQRQYLKAGRIVKEEVTTHAGVSTG